MSACLARGDDRRRLSARLIAIDDDLVRIGGSFETRERDRTGSHHFGQSILICRRVASAA